MWSDDRETTRDAANITDELHALLEVASEPPPYVMVGHSLGGPLARVFDHRFPGEVVGFVFVDSSHPEQDARLSPEIAAAGRVSPLLLRTLSAIGVLRLTSSSMTDALPEQAAAAVSAFVPESMSGAIAEIAAVDAVLEQARETGTLAERPIVVLTAPRPIDPLPSGVDRAITDRMQEIWGELQAEIAALSTNSDHRVLPHASHYIHWDHPDAVVAPCATWSRR